jgi:hypothetical protein
MDRDYTLAELLDCIADSEISVSFDNKRATAATYIRIHSTWERLPFGEWLARVNIQSREDCIDRCPSCRESNRNIGGPNSIIPCHHPWHIPSEASA